MSDKKQSPLAGKTVKIKAEVKYIGGETYHVEDYWQNIAGKSWVHCDGNPACLDYAARSAVAGLPLDNDVLYGKIGSFGKLVHVSEIDDSEPT